MKKIIFFILFSVFIAHANGQNSELQNLINRAIAGDPSSQNGLGLYYIQNGNKIEAIEWWKKAAAQNHAGASVNLGSYYLEAGSKEAKYWYLKGAELRDSLAYRGLGLYYDRIEKDTEASLKWLKKGANSGDVNSQRILGFWYYNQNDFSSAISFFSPAVERGDKSSMKGIADSYYNIKDYKNAIFWYHERAVQGDLESQCQLSYMYTYGQGTDIDYKEARYWLIRAAEGGLAQAQFNLALFYSRGSIGLDQNEEKAFDWFKKAAAQGHPDSLNNVGVYYYNQGNFEEARYWWELAEQKGCKYAENNIRRLK
ncbi:MAG: sel1 repeat family protein [Muribaculaceae bacterium]|nr:sel1 repeat family protein [Muribaculaceae bacterium]